MPAHEGRLSEALEQNRSIEALYDALTMPSIGTEKKSHVVRRSSKVLPEDSRIEGEPTTSFLSAPSKEEHEKFLRDFFEIILQEAVFKVRKILQLFTVFRNF